MFWSKINKHEGWDNENELELVSGETHSPTEILFLGKGANHIPTPLFSATFLDIVRVQNSSHWPKAKANRGEQ